MVIPGVVLFLEQRNLIPVQLLWLVRWWPGSRGAEVAAISVIGRAWAEPVDDYWLLASSTDTAVHPVFDLGAGAHL